MEAQTCKFCAVHVSLLLSVLKLFLRGNLMAKQTDGVVEAVRYKNGQIAAVRIYERRGATYSDRIVLDRKTLVERLQKGQLFISGSRQDLMAGTFTLAKPLQLVQTEGREVIATRENSTKDELEGVPFF